MVGYGSASLNKLEECILIAFSETDGDVSVNSKRFELFETDTNLAETDASPALSDNSLLETKLKLMERHMTTSLTAMTSIREELILLPWASYREAQRGH